MFVTSTAAIQLDLGLEGVPDFEIEIDFYEMKMSIK